MPRTLAGALALALALAAGSSACERAPRGSAVPAPATTAACGPQADGSRRLRILHINDVYRIEGTADGRGNLARLRTLRRELEADCDALLLTHAGDTLYPSLLSREYQGGQMIEILNLLDGDAEGFDARMIATFGNHEFDAAKLEDAAKLDELVEASQFDWLDTNIRWGLDAEGQAHVAADNLHAERLLELGGVRVGLFSLLTDAAVPAYVDAIDTRYVELARDRVAELRSQGAELVIALTHLAAADDQRLLDELGVEGPDLILGGHDHVLMNLVPAGVELSELGAGPAVLKGDADALRVRVLEVRVDAEGRVGWTTEVGGRALGPETPAPDPAVQTAIDARLEAFDLAFCGAEDRGCLERELSVANTTLRAEELEIRRYESNYGDWILDRMLAAFAEDGAELAFLNAGSLRLNQDILAGTTITRQIVEETFAYPVNLRLLEVEGAVLQEVLDHAVEEWSSAGHWLQIAGWAYRHDVEAGRARDPVWLGPEGPAALDPARRYRVVATDFLLDPASGQDGYTMLTRDMIIESPRAGQDLKQIVIDALAAAGPAGIGPEVEGRICSSDRPELPCLVP